ncbi:MAG: hypothetical protein KGI00_01925 [Candidatus Micrarchaeota archaeon]|nr:hypothetical protein [Candidatus Micrarchaeota archaeon]MDE1823843.1 hypothetical protein [Candidatus Micrarchaeota archaeon]MDE1849467.1 hypothetical protein [Candidatus Micrarchaeota archaeon]MDE1869351.1 hypothetical protein [Candidatus Micrarchaeota archaeon]
MKKAQEHENRQCSICGLHYKDKELAEECHAWCSTHKSCNLKIATQSLEAQKRRFDGN